MTGMCYVKILLDEIAASGSTIFKSFSIEKLLGNFYEIIVDENSKIIMKVFFLLSHPN